MNLSNAAVKTHDLAGRVPGRDLVADSGVVVWLTGEQVALFYLPGQEQALYAIGQPRPALRGQHHRPRAGGQPAG
jgi:nitrite reductase (NADH) small subunit